MAKEEQQSSDYFKVFFDIDVNALGAVVAVLTKMGLPNVGYELVTEIRSFGTNRKYAETGIVTALRTMMDGAPHAAKDMREAFRAAGRDTNSVPSVISSMVEKGLAKKTGPGTYRLTAAGVKRAIKTQQPDQDSAPALALPKPQQQSDKTAGEVIEQLLSDGKPHDLAEMRKLFESLGRQASSVSGQISIMIGEKTITRVSSGVYQAGTPAPARGVSTAILLTALKEGPKTWEQLTALFESKGQTVAVLKSAVDRFRTQKVVKNSGDEGYKIVNQKAADAAIARVTPMNGVQGEGTHG